MVKIFHPLLCYYPSQAGGPANTLFWLNNALDNRKFEVNVLSTDFGLNDTAKEEKQGLFTNSHQVEFINSQGKLFLKKGRRFLKTADIVQFSSIFFPPTLPLLLSAFIRSKKIIISPRGELYPAALQIKSKQKKIWLSLIKLFQNKIHFHATNEYEKEIIKNYFPGAGSIRTIPNYIELPIKEEKKIDKNQLLFIGRINPIKNIDVLIRSLSLIKQGGRKYICLSIAGNARLEYEKLYQKDLEKLIKRLNLQENVKFIGHVEKEEKQNLIASSLALILPSKSENFGNVVLEALAQGTPVIASNNTPWEILEKENAGYLVEPKPDSLSEAILKIISLTESEYSNMRQCAFNLCDSKFNIKSNIHHWEYFYKSIIH